MNETDFDFDPELFSSLNEQEYCEHQNIYVGHGGGEPRIEVNQEPPRIEERPPLHIDVAQAAPGHQYQHLHQGLGGVEPRVEVDPVRIDVAQVAPGHHEADHSVRSFPFCDRIYCFVLMLIAGDVAGEIALDHHFELGVLLLLLDSIIGSKSRFYNNGMSDGIQHFTLSCSCQVACRFNMNTRKVSVFSTKTTRGSSDRLHTKECEFGNLSTSFICFVLVRLHGCLLCAEAFVWQSDPYRKRVKYVCRDIDGVMKSRGGVPHNRYA